MKNQITTTDGVDLYTIDWGQGQPIVFLSSWALNSTMWCYQMAPLSDRGYRCIAYDRRGHGRSSDPGRNFDYDTLAGDLATVLAQLDLNDVTLVTHSMGAGEAIRYLTRYGSDRVRGLVLVGTCTPSVRKSADNPNGVDPALFEHVRNAMLLEDFPQWCEDNAAAYFASSVSRGVIDWTIQTIHTASLKALIECNRTLETSDFTAELRDITVPTLLVHGEVDQSHPLDQTARRTAALMQEVELRVYEGAGHGLYFTHKHRLNEDIMNFVKRLSAPVGFVAAMG